MSESGYSRDIIDELRQIKEILLRIDNKLEKS